MKRHPVELFSLISGTAFLAYACVYLARGTDTSAGVLLPLLLVALGAAGLAAALVSQRRLDQSTSAAADEPEDQDTF